MHPIGTYFGIRTAGDEVIDFGWSAERCFDFIRAISEPGPRARFFVQNHEYMIQGAELIPNAPSYISTIGEVVGKVDRGIIVKVADTTILLTDVRKANDGTIAPKFKIGTRLSSVAAY